MTRHYDHVLGFALEHPWAITRPMLSVIAGILARRVAGQDVDRAELEAALVNRKNLPQPQAGSIAIIPVYGVIAPRMNMLSEMSGGTTFEKLTAQLREALGNKSVKTIVFDIDSPGGNAAGATEFAREVMRARVKKPIIAVANYLMASAAYWVGAAATEIVASPSAKVGSVGVYTSHDDLSGAFEQVGLKRTYLSAGDGKTYGNEAEPLSAEAEARIQTMINDAYGLFVGDVVKGRGQPLTAERVRSEWKALVYSAPEALAMGMIDSVATLDETLARVLSTSPDAADRQAAQTFVSDDTSPPTDTAQEPSGATAQDRSAELALEHQLFELQLTD